MRNAFTVQAEQLASAVHYVAKWLVTRPTVPSHGGILFEVDGDRLSLFGFNENTTAKAIVEIDASDEPKGAFVVSGRLMDQLVSTFPSRPVRFEQDGGTVSVTVGSFRATLPVMSDDDYPALPGAASLAGYIAGPVLADAVRRMGAAASRDLTKEVALCGIHIDFGVLDDESEAVELPAHLTLCATDKYRAGRQRVEWTPDPEGAPFGEVALVLGAVLVDAVDGFEQADQVAIGWDDGMFSLTTDDRSLVVRTMSPVGFPIEGLAKGFNSTPPVSAQIHVKDLVLPLKRADMLRGKDGGEAVRLAFRENMLTVEVSGMNQGGEEIEVVYNGDESSLMAKSSMLRDALNTTPGDVAVLSFDPANFRQPAIVTAPADPEWRHLFSPLRPSAGGK